MPVQDLTPQLRTRLSRVERAVGIFVTMATLILIGGFGYYLHHTAERKGWFLNRVPYHTFLDTAAGIRVGDQVRMMGSDAGEITEITLMDPYSTYGNIYVQFEIKSPYYGYIWNDSAVKVPTDFLGKRVMEITKGGTRRTNDLHESYQEVSETAKGFPGEKFFRKMIGSSSAKKKVTGIWDDKESKYKPFAKGSKGYTLIADDSPPLADRMEMIANMAQTALPNILGLTNQISAVLSNVTIMTDTANKVLASAQPIVTNLTTITDNIKNPKGSLGEWLIPTNINSQLDVALSTATVTLTNANSTLAAAETNLVTLNKSLESLAGISSNLNVQVQANTNLVKGISDAITHADEMLIGLKRHWLLKGAFKTNKPSTKPPKAPKVAKPKK